MSLYVRRKDHISVHANNTQALFAMQGLFNWESTASDGEGDDLDVVSPKFWIYWVTAIPLTLVTLIGWAIWWRYEIKRYPDDPEDHAPAPPGFVTQLMETLGWSAADIQPTPEKRQRDTWVFGGQRRQSKLGNESSEILDAEAAAAMRSPYTTPKSPHGPPHRPFP